MDPQAAANAKPQPSTKPMCPVCNKPAVAIYKHHTDPVSFCSMGCAGKYKNTNKVASTGCNVYSLPTLPRNGAL